MAGHVAKAWCLRAGTGRDRGRLASLELESIEVRDPGEGELLVEPLYGCWEGNMDHALTRDPVDVNKQREEERVVLGNSGVVRVLRAGPGVEGWREGSVALVFAASALDALGYPEKIFAYDAPGTIGCLATRTVMRAHELLPLPEETRHALASWAAFSLRSVTAWSNWELAYGTFRLQAPAEELPAPHVWGWGGGTTLAELDLARRAGCRAVMLSASDGHLAEIAATGVTALDRRAFGPLRYKERTAADDAEERRVYLEAERAFLREVARRTDGQGVHIFVDYVGAPVMRATQKALARLGVITSAGWKEGMTTSFLRGVACIARQQHVHTHYARRGQGAAAVAYGEASGWVPRVTDAVWRFEDVPALARSYHEGRTGYFPVYAVCPE